MSGILSIEMIKASGALTSHKPIKKEIEWTVGIETFKADVMSASYRMTHT